MTSTVPGGRIDPLYNVIASHNTHVVCLNFIRECRRDLQFNVDSERQIFFEKLFHGKFYLLSEFFQEISADFEIAEKIFFFIYCFDVWLGIRTRALRLISQHTIYSTMVTSKILELKFLQLNFFYSFSYFWSIELGKNFAFHWNDTKSGRKMQSSAMRAVARKLNAYFS